MHPQSDGDVLHTVGELQRGPEARLLELAASYVSQTARFLLGGGEIFTLALTGSIPVRVTTWQGAHHVKNPRHGSLAVLVIAAA